MPKKFSHHFQEGFSKHARKISDHVKKVVFVFVCFWLAPKKLCQKDFSDHVTWRVFQIMPERFFRSCQEGIFKWSQKDFSDQSRRVFQIMQERFLRSCQEGVFKLCQKHFSDQVKKRFFKSCQRDFFRSCQEGFFKLCQRDFSDRVKEGVFKSCQKDFSDQVKNHQTSLSNQLTSCAWWSRSLTPELCQIMSVL